MPLEIFFKPNILTEIISFFIRNGGCYIYILIMLQKQVSKESYEFI